ncbi:DUF3006 domain-containing protein [Oceanobacillus salinisoli]|uniref:DUF3006 domain-containing protein n=1 Tax=Oceanobacillus salinisoli TaxID=2678611 RepID=UPI0018CC1A6E|nr:DUF3006 domain-containing protein [Oceanobacillus salinisoli]
MIKGVLDRFEGNNAVILIEELKEEMVVPREKLPEGSMVNTYFNLEKKDDKFEIVSIDEHATMSDSQKSSDLMAKLRSKSKGSKFRK